MHPRRPWGTSAPHNPRQRHPNPRPDRGPAIVAQTLQREFSCLGGYGPGVVGRHGDRGIRSGWGGWRRRGVMIRHRAPRGQCSSTDQRRADEGGTAGLTGWTYSGGAIHVDGGHGTKRAMMRCLDSAAECFRTDRLALDLGAGSRGTKQECQMDCQIPHWRFPPRGWLFAPQRHDVIAAPCRMGDPGPSTQSETAVSAHGHERPTSQRTALDGSTEIKSQRIRASIRPWLWRELRREPRRPQWW